jgi:hypothetical protein
MSDTDPEWPDLAYLFGEENVATIDLAVAAFLAKHPDGIKADDYYLVSEGLTYSVLMALRESHVRLVPVVENLR